VTVCEKVVARLNKHDDVIERKFMKIAPLEIKSWLRPCDSSIQYLSSDAFCEKKQFLSLTFDPSAMLLNKYLNCDPN